MPSTTCTRIAAAGAALALAACAAPEPEAAVDPIIASAPSAELDFAASQVAAALRGEIGPAGGGALTDVSREGGIVTAVLEVPLPAADLGAAQREAAAGAIRDTFVAERCAEAGLAGFFDRGGTLRVVARGTDGAELADLPVTACA